MKRADLHSRISFNHLKFKIYLEAPDVAAISQLKEQETSAYYLVYIQNNTHNIMFLSGMKPQSLLKSVPKSWLPVKGQQSYL